MKPKTLIGMASYLHGVIQLMYYCQFVQALSVCYTVKGQSWGFKANSLNYNTHICYNVYSKPNRSCYLPVMTKFIEIQAVKVYLGCISETVLKFVRAVSQKP